MPDAAAIFKAHRETNTSRQHPELTDTSNRCIIRAILMKWSSFKCNVDSCQASQHTCRGMGGEFL